MNSRTFVIGDIHGGYKALEQVLKKAKPTPDDRLIFLGDYVDGWSDSPQVIRKLIDLRATHNCIFLRGNHDDLFEKWLLTGESNELWLNHGGRSTLEAYASVSRGELEVHKAFLTQLENYYIDDSNRAFLHAGYTNMGGPKKEYYPYTFYWDRTLWETALATDPTLKVDDYRYPKRLTHFKEIFIGHTSLTRIGVDKPLKALNVWNIDTGAAFTGKLSMMEIHTHQLFQSDPVHTLYPDEKGRN